jgi:hypothetical protein
MKQLTTTKHIIFVILLLVIILSLFRGNIVEGYPQYITPQVPCDKINDGPNRRSVCTHSNNKDYGCLWDKDTLKCKYPTSCDQLKTYESCGNYNFKGCWWKNDKDGCQCNNGKDKKKKPKPCNLEITMLDVQTSLKNFPRLEDP